VGWPLHPGSEPPQLTFDIADQLLIDGTDSVLQGERAERLRRRQIAAALFALVGSLMLGAFAHEVRRPRTASSLPGPEPTAELVLAPQRWWIGFALACLLGGFAALTYFGLLQR
jgi:drug/metabolite transporter (DMT)-like permease